MSVNLDEALHWHRAGEWDRAQSLYQEVLQLEPRHVGARYHLGLLFFQTQRSLEAQQQFSKVLNIAPEHVGAWFNLATVQFELNDFKACAESYRAGLKINPQSDPAWLNLGLALREVGEREEALRCCRQALALNPIDPHIHYNLALMMRESSPIEALDHYDQALRLDPQLSQAWFNRAGLLCRLGQLEPALASFEQAIELDANSAEFFHARANVLAQLHRFERSLEDYDRALSLQSNEPQVWSNRGVLLSAMGLSDQALESLDRAIAIDPNFADAHFNRGHLHLKKGQHRNARVDFDRLLVLAPQTSFAQGSRLHAKMLDCDWAGFWEDTQQLVLALRAGDWVVNPFELSALVDDAQLQHLAAQGWSRAKHPPLALLGALPQAATPLGDHEKIRVGYFSSDFRMHAVSQGAAPLFENHDKAQFEVMAFSLTRVAEDAVRERIRCAVDRFFDVHTLSDLEVAQLARSLKLDIAIDLNGYTLGARTSIFAHRVAPVQASYLGYLGGMGAPYMDYVLADETLVPQGQEAAYDEKIIHLPCYQINDRLREVSTRVLTRRELGLPESGFVFCSFNQTYKINPLVFASWVRILQATPSSVLYLVIGAQEAQNHLRQEAQRRGLNPKRLIFGERLSPSENLARFPLCDLLLDAWPYNAGVTGSDALWMGLPLLTMEGQSFAARMGASLLRAMRLPELICTSLDDYEARAHEIATQAQVHCALVEKIHLERCRAPLFDAPLFTRHLERAYRDVHELAKQGLPAAHWWP